MFDGGISETIYRQFELSCVYRARGMRYADCGSETRYADCGIDSRGAFIGRAVKHCFLLRHGSHLGTAASKFSRMALLLWQHISSRRNEGPKDVSGDGQYTLSINVEANDDL